MKDEHGHVIISAVRCKRNSNFGAVLIVFKKALIYGNLTVIVGEKHDV